MDSISNSNFGEMWMALQNFVRYFRCFLVYDVTQLTQSALTWVVREYPNVNEGHARSAISSVPLNCRKSTLSRKEGSVFAVKSERTSWNRSELFTSCPVHIVDRAEPRSAISEGNICARDLTHWKQIDLQHLDVRDPTMSCWETFQELEVGQRNKILLELQEIYGGSFEFDATIYLMQWLEQQAW